MKIEDLIKELEKIKKEHGNLDVYISYWEFDGEHFDKEASPYIREIKIYENKEDTERTTKKAIIFQRTSY